MSSRFLHGHRTPVENTGVNVTVWRTLLGEYPATRALRQGRVESPLLRLDLADVSTPNKAFRRVVRDLEFDVAELALMTFLMARSRGAPLRLLPVVLFSRNPLQYLVCRADRRGDPCDLSGRRIGASFQYVIFRNPSWDYHSFSLATDIDTADPMEGGRINNAIDPRLTPFFDRGGKLLMYHGWSDHHISPVNSINYYTSVVGAVSDVKAGQSIRLFMAPGMAHCASGDGPNTFDRIGPIRAWVERDTAPERIVASKTTNGRSCGPGRSVPIRRSRAGRGAAAATTRRISAAPVRGSVPPSRASRATDTNRRLRAPARPAIRRGR